MDYQKIGKDAAKSDSVQRPIDKNLVLQLDADFACYECAHVEEPVSRNFNNLKNRIRMLRALSGAGTVNVHVTLGLKGGRSQMATTKPYQENRAGKGAERKARVEELRVLLMNYQTENIVPCPSVLQEADDALAQYQVARIKAKGVTSSAIMSSDKDLWMVEGQHIDPKTGKFYTVKGYGKTELRDVGNVKPKLVGEGTSWFWHQMLMGDAADNIAGLPTLSGRLLEVYLPKKKPDENRKAAQCGQEKAMAVLRNVRTDKVAARTVLACYRGHYGMNMALEQFVESAFLLWMRRTDKLSDCVAFLNESGITCAFTERQRMRLKEYVKLAKMQLAVVTE